MGVVQGAAVMEGSWLRSSRSHTSSTPSALAAYITPAPSACTFATFAELKRDALTKKEAPCETTPQLCSLQLT